MKMNTVLTEVDERGVAVVTLNRPEVHNAFDDVLIGRLTEVLSELNDDSNVRVVQLTGAGPSFSSGADFNWMRSQAKNTRPKNLKDAMGLATLMQTLAGTSKPTIARIHGSAYGGGIGLIACCDIAVASERARFCLSEVKFGLVPAVIAPYVVAAIGPRAARRYTLTAEVFDAGEAQRLGLIHKAVEDNRLEVVAEEFTRALLQNGPEAMAAAKDLIEAVTWRRMDDSVIADTAKRIADLRASTEGQEGISAFLEKREPGWVRR